MVVDEFQYPGALFICIILGKMPTVLAAGVGKGCVDNFLSAFRSFSLSLSLSLSPAGNRLKCDLRDPLTPSPPYDGPYGSLFISIPLHNSEFRILNSEFRIPKFALRISEFGIRNCEVYVVWASGNS